MDAPLHRLLTLLIAVSLIMAPVGSALAMVGMAGEHAVSVHCPESGTAPADGLHTDQADADQSRADGTCCDAPCLMSCSHGATALPAELVTLSLYDTDPAVSSVAALANMHFPPPGHPPKAR